MPFFAVSKDSTPFVASFSPKNTASVGVDEASGVKIEIYFSESMDRKSAETAFSLDGASDKKFLWTRDDKTLSVTIGKPLSAWTVYHWSIKAPMP
ncbi:MAG: Ig-like domain-containing protein [Treponema sp.]|nr:Ig-like domain-containing protein [Treponema sp.]